MKHFFLFLFCVVILIAGLLLIGNESRWINDFSDIDVKKSLPIFLDDIINKDTIYLCYSFNSINLVSYA